MLMRKHLSGSAKAIDDLVDVQMDAISAAQAFDLRQVFVTAMNAPAAALAEKINGLMGGGYHTYFIVGRAGGGRRYGNAITLCPPLVIPGPSATGSSTP